MVSVFGERGACVVSVCGECVDFHVPWRMCGAEDSCVEFFYLYMGSRGQTQVVRPTSKCLYLLNSRQPSTLSFESVSVSQR